jgi:hypothetical protein
VDFSDIARIFHPRDTYSFSAAYRTFSKINILGDKGSLNKCKRTEIISCILSIIE